MTKKRITAITIKHTSRKDRTEITIQRGAYWPNDKSPTDKNWIHAVERHYPLNMRLSLFLNSESMQKRMKYDYSFFFSWGVAVRYRILPEDPDA